MLSCRISNLACQAFGGNANRNMRAIANTMPISSHPRLGWILNAAEKRATPIFNGIKVAAHKKIAAFASGITANITDGVT